jgi:hypothetical protein
VSSVEGQVDEAENGLIGVLVSRSSHIQRRMETKQPSLHELEAIQLCKVKQ